MIDVKNISKSFGNIKAVDELSFKVEKGEVLGLLGPNGAGKTTTMRMLTGYLYPDDGTITINGKNILKNTEKIRKNIGYMPENNPIYKDMLVEELLKFVLSLRGVEKKNQRKLIDKVVKETGIEKVYYRPIGELSKGYKQRVGLAQALIHEPEILILDEPTEGLDPNQRNDIRKLIKEIGKERTIIISTHVMQEVSAMCNRVVIINEGKLVADGSPKELEENAQGGGIIELTVAGTGVIAELKELKEVIKIDTISGRTKQKEFEIQYTGEETFFESLSKLVRKKKWTIYKLNERTSSLEDIFYQLTK